MDFRLGKIDVTLRAICALGSTGTHLLTLLVRHAEGDYGQIAPEEHRKSMQRGEAIYSDYTLPHTAISLLIITEGDRSATHVVLGEEYV